MTKNSFKSMISFTFSFFQIIIYILDYVNAENMNSYPSITNFNYTDLTIIDIRINYFRFVNFASYSNLDNVILLAPFNGKEGIIFYGFKENGRPFFNDYLY